MMLPAASIARWWVAVPERHAGYQRCLLLGMTPADPLATQSSIGATSRQEQSMKADTSEKTASAGVTTAPLDGVRVLDFGHVFAGPFCTRCLADLGAEVLHVETRGRQAAPRPAPQPGAPANPRGGGGEAGRAAYAYRNKLSVTIDLKTPAGQQLATRLASVADVLVENFSSGAMRRLKLDYDSLQPLNPRLIYVSMSGYGHSGPRRDWTSMNMNLQAFSGLMMTTGEEGDGPIAISNSWNDYIGGLHASFEVLQALAERVETGVGKNIDLAQFECSVGTLGPLLLACAVNRAPPRRMGNRSASCAPQGCYPCAGADEWCTLVVRTDDHWRGLAQAMGDPEWTANPRFASATGRLAHHDEIDDLITGWTSKLSAVEAEERLQAAGVPAERMRKTDAVVDSPDAGQVFAPLETLTNRRTLTARLPFTFSSTPTVEPQKVPRLGADTHVGLQRWLGLSDSEIGALEAEEALR
jgi:crotonobetainyl-CoA:carnitine CoA-transferase CaiB-like acyl-CoA transferase